MYPCLQDWMQAITVWAHATNTMQLLMVYPVLFARPLLILPVGIRYTAIGLLVFGWWFGTFFIFPYIGKSNPNWLIFLRGVETTNQVSIFHYLSFVLSITAPIPLLFVYHYLHLFTINITTNCKLNWLYYCMLINLHLLTPIYINLFTLYLMFYLFTMFCWPSYLHGCTMFIHSASYR